MRDSLHSIHTAWVSDVARSTSMGNVRASICRTSSDRISRHFVKPLIRNIKFVVYI